jgi:dTDP-4-amino-4,6-dideoxygalactose transaminase
VPKAVIVVHLYGQSADLDPICAVANEYGVPVIEDAAEALGATYRGEAPGTAGRFGVYSFNGNKIITTSGGGMLVGRNPNELDHARKLSSQARESAPHYEHREVGYNYRLSNILAAIGRGQLRVLEDRVLARRRLFEVYSTALGDIEGITFAPEAPWGRHTRWLTTVLIDPARFGTDREAVRASLEDANIEARPLWKPMHTQPVYRGCTSHGGSVSEALFRDGLCLPSGSAMTEADIGRVVAEIRRCAAGRTPVAAAGATHGA